VSYVDAGYVVTFVVLSAYALGLVLRRRRLERAVALAERERPARPGAPEGTAR